MRFTSGKFIGSAVVAAAMLFGGASLVRAGEFDLRIIHMNDIHSHLATEYPNVTLGGEQTYVEMGGIPRAATMIKKLAAGASNHLILNAGDTFQGTLYYTLFQGDATAAMLNHIDWDAIALGNHEFDDGDTHLAEYLGKLDAPIISANVIPASGNVLEGMWTPYVIKEFSGQKVGIIGLNIAQKTKVSSRPSDEITFWDEVTTAQKYVDELIAAGISKVILLSHYGLENDIKLAEQVSGIDVIIDGDSHSLLGDLSELGISSSYPYPVEVKDLGGKKVCIAQAWQYAKMVGCLDVIFNDDAESTVASCSGQSTLLLGDSFKRKDADGNKLEVTDTSALSAIHATIDNNPNVEAVAEDDEALVTLAGYQAQVDQLQQQMIGQAGKTLSHVRIPTLDYLGNLGSDFPLGSEIAPLVAKSFYDLSLRADACIQNAGGVRTNIDEGDITIGTAYTLLPFANTLFEIEMKGNEIKQVLEDALSNYYDNGGSSGSFPYAYGLKYDVNVSKPMGMRITNLEIKDRETGAWSIINADTMYVVVTNSYTGAGKDGYITFQTVQEERGPGIDTYLDYAMSFVQYVENLYEQGEAVAPLPVEDHCIKSFIDKPAVELSLLGSYATGDFDKGAAEIVAHDPETQLLFVVNGNDNAIDILDINDPANIVKSGVIDLSAYGAAPNSVAVKNGLVAVAVESDPKQDPGKVVFFSTYGTFLKQLTVGALPDMVTFTPDGRKVLVANEGEPNDDYTYPLTKPLLEYQAEATALVSGS